MSRPVLRTGRIELRPMTEEHLPWLEELDGDPEVLRFILGRARTPEEVARFWGPHCRDTEADAHGLGFWVGVDAAGGFLGWWDASPDPPSVEAGAPAAEPGRAHPATAEVGWRLRRRCWGQGLATEGAEAVVHHCFETVGLDWVWAETMAVNHGSRGVMRKLGMRYVATHWPAWLDPLPGADQGEVVYRLTREEWRRTTGPGSTTRPGR